MAQFSFIKHNTKIPFIAIHKPVLIGLASLAVISILLSFIIGPNWGTSFEGGTAVTIDFVKPVETEDVRRVFVDDPRFEKVSVQSLGQDDSLNYVVRMSTSTTLTCDKLQVVKNKMDANVAQKTQNAMVIGQWPSCNPEIEDGIRGDFYVTIVPADERTPKPETLPVSAKELNDWFIAADLQSTVEYDESAKRFIVKPLGIQNDITNLLNDEFGDSFDAATGLKGITTVGADVGEKFRTDAIVSIILALGLMLLYIGIRFDARYAPAAVASLAISVCITWGCIVCLRQEITLETVAALLSLVGYGVNDTIVNFDRIRENTSLADPGVKLSDIINKSINDCLSRTICTSLTTLIAIVPMAILATGSTRDFAVIMTIGIVLTTIGSIFLSCPFMLYMDKWFKNMQNRSEERKKLEELPAETH